MFLALLLMITAQAVEVEPGGMYEGGQVLTASGYGVSVAVPEGQVAAVSEESISIGSLLSALGTSVHLTKDDEGALRTKLAAPYVANDITWTATDVRRDGTHLVATLQGQTLLGGSRVGRLETVPGAHGWTAIVLTSGKPKHAAQLDAQHAAVLATVKLSKPAASVASGASATLASGGAAVPAGSGPDLPRSGAWGTALSGKQLKFLYTSNNSTSSRQLFLCADGRAYYYSEFSAASGIASSAAGGYSAATQDDGRGTWGVRGDTLIAADAEERAEWSLSRDAEGFLQLDGERWFEIDDLEGHCR